MSPPSAPSEEEECASTLNDLYEAVQRLKQAGEPLPSATGGAFWKAVAEREHVGSPPHCEAARRRWGNPVPPYRGPSCPFNEIPEKGIIGCDREGSHPGGLRILHKDGTVTVAPRGSEEHARALRETAD